MLLVDEGGHAAVHGAQLALDLGAQLLGLGPLAVELLGPSGLVHEALGEAGAGAVEPLPGPGDPVDQGQVGPEDGLLEGQPGQGVGRVVGADQVGQEPAGAGQVAAAGSLVQVGLGGADLALGRLALAVQVGGVAEEVDAAGVRLLEVLGQPLQPPVLGVELAPQAGRPGPQRAQAPGGGRRGGARPAGPGRPGRGGTRRRAGRSRGPRRSAPERTGDGGWSRRAEPAGAGGSSRPPAQGADAGGAFGSTPGWEWVAAWDLRALPMCCSLDPGSVPGAGRMGA